jgi:ankyrin repeat protein
MTSTPSLRPLNFNCFKTPQDVKIAVAKGIPVNGKHSSNGRTALHWAVVFERRELVVALMAAGADANVKEPKVGGTSVWWCAPQDIANILQLLIDGGGSANEANNYGQTPLIALVTCNDIDAAARLEILLACPELDLDVIHRGMTAKQFAVALGYCQLAVAIANEQARRERWSVFRVAWMAATVMATTNVLSLGSTVPL